MELFAVWNGLRYPISPTSICSNQIIITRIFFIYNSLILSQMKKYFKNSVCWNISKSITIFVIMGRVDLFFKKAFINSSFFSCSVITFTVILELSLLYLDLYFGISWYLKVGILYPILLKENEYDWNRWLKKMIEIDDWKAVI